MIPILQNETYKQFVKFGMIGISNTIISLSIYYALIGFRANYIFANTVAFIISVASSYFLNNRYVFKKTKIGHKLPLIKTYISYLVTLVLSSLILYFWVDVLEYSKYTAPLISIPLCLPINFFMNKMWAFR